MNHENIPIYTKIITGKSKEPVYSILEASNISIFSDSVACFSSDNHSVLVVKMFCLKYYSSIQDLFKLSLGYEVDKLPKQVIERDTAH